MAGVRTLTGGGRFTITVGGDPPKVVKRGDPAALTYEALGLRHVAGTGVAPAVLRLSRGQLITEHLDASSRDLGAISIADGRRLGRTLRDVHESRHTGTGKRPPWRRSVGTLTGYWNARAADRAAYCPRRLGYLADAVSAIRYPSPPMTRRPFRLLHGDLVAANILWDPSPRLIDWEFWRMGDPAEDLAYLIGVNAVPDNVRTAIVAGYDNPAVAARIDAWMAPCLFDAGLWYFANGNPDAGQAMLDRVRRLLGGRAIPA